MKAIVKREIKNYLQNPIFYAGTIIIIIGLYQILAPFLNLHYWENDKQIQDIQLEVLNDADITEGYIPTSVEEQAKIGFKEIRKELINILEMTGEEADAAIKDTMAHAQTVREMCRYLEKNYSYSYKSAYYLFNSPAASIRQGSAQEVNEYMKECFEHENYSWYLARKYADFAGLYIIFFVMILMAFLFIQDTRKSTYELLHTKPVSATQYILGKIMGGFLVTLSVLIIVTIIFTVLCLRQGLMQGFPVSVFDLWTAVIIYILPNLVMVICVYAGIAVLFKSPLPATPLLFLYMVYSNMGSNSADGIFGYYGRPLAIIVRFPGRFLETTPPPYVWLNQIFLLFAATGIIILCINIWRRRRVY